MPLRGFHQSSRTAEKRREILQSMPKEIDRIRQERIDKQRGQLRAKRSAKVITNQP
jgi:hypothetical protein